MRLAIFLLFFSNAAIGQNLNHFRDSSFVRILPDLPADQPFDTAHSYNRVKDPYVYISSDNDMYTLFGYMAGVRYREFDFANYHIFGSKQCRKCIAVCNGRPGCHRDRCMFSWVWVVRENKKAFTEVLSKTSPASRTGHLSGIVFYNDSIIKESTDSAKVKWYTSAGGDCFAKFIFHLYKDNYYPVLLLKEYNYWGGCRAGGSWNFSIDFKMPAGILYHVKNVILMEKILH